MRDESGSNHGCRTWGPVAAAIRVAIATLCLPVHGCDSVQGGAVELSWKLRPTSSALPDKFVDCDPGNPRTEGRGSVTQIRLHWRVPVPGAVIESSAAWSCKDNHGVTGFDLPAGTADLWLTPECGGTGPSAFPALPDTFVAPATVQRAVSVGNTVSLGAVELVVAVSYCQNADPLDPRSPPQRCICDGSDPAASPRTP
jgi:hypothetical protein